MQRPPAFVARGRRCCSRVQPGRQGIPYRLRPPGWRLCPGPKRVRWNAFPGGEEDELNVLYPAG